MIQETSKVALQNGMHIDILFEQLDRNYETVSALPVYLMGYFNQFCNMDLKDFWPGVLKQA